MARSFLTPINLNQNELQNARIQNLATAPSTPVTGQVYYNTSTNNLYIYNGTAWAEAGAISAGTLSARPTASSVSAGTFYYATDNYLIYESNGTVWQQTQAFGSGQSTALTIAGTSADGTSTNYARADHTHAGPGFGSVTAAITYGISASTGSATTVAHSDHTHGTPSLSATAANAVSSTSSTAGSVGTASDSGHSHGLTTANFPLNTFGTPTASFSMGGYNITNLAAPVNAGDAVNKAYADAAASSLNVHGSVEYLISGTIAGTYAAGTTGADGGTGVGATITYAATGQLTIDTGPDALQLGDRVLVTGGVTAYAGSTSIANGIYTVTTNGSSGVATVLTRATDYDNHIQAQVVAGDFIYVSYGTVYGKTGWVQTVVGTSTTPYDGIKFGTDGLNFTQFSGAGTYTASNGVSLTGSNFTFAPLSTGGLATGSTGGYILLPSTSGLATSSSGLTFNPTATGGLTTNSSGALILLATNSGLATSSSGLTVTAGLGITLTGSGAATANTVAVDTTVVVRKYATTIGNGSSTSFTVTHNLGTQDVQVTLYDASTFVEYYADVTHSTTNTVTVAFANAPTTNQIRVVVFA